MATFNFFNSVRVFAASSLNAGAAGCYAAGDALASASRKVAGDQWNRSLFSAFIEAHGLKEAVAEVEAEKPEKQEEKHSDMVQKKGHRWVASQKAVDAAKKSGHDKALIPHLYTAANWIAACAEEGAEKVYSAGNGTAHTYAGWVFAAVRKHADFLAKKGVKNADTPEALKKYFESACKQALTDKELPTWESICEYVQKEGAAAAEPAPSTVEPTPEAAAKEEPRDGRAPKKAATPKKAAAKGVNEAIHSLGFPRLTKKAAFEIAQKAAEAAETGVIDESMRDAIINACIAKDGGDPEEFYALMGQN